MGARGSARTAAAARNARSPTHASPASAGVAREGASGSSARASTTAERAVGLDADARNAPRRLGEHALGRIAPGQARRRRQLRDGGRSRNAAAATASTCGRLPMLVATPVDQRGHAVQVSIAAAGAQVSRRCPSPIRPEPWPWGRGRRGSTWLLLPALAGPAVGRRAGRGQYAACAGSRAAGLWAGWAVVLVAVLVPGAASLTALRIAAPQRSAAAGAAALTGDPRATDAIALGGAVLAIVAAMAAPTADAFVDGSSYGDERRFALRSPDSRSRGGRPAGVADGRGAAGAARHCCWPPGSGSPVSRVGVVGLPLAVGRGPAPPQPGPPLGCVRAGRRRAPRSAVPPEPAAVPATHHRRHRPGHRRRRMPTARRRSSPVARPGLAVALRLRTPVRIGDDDGHDRGVHTRAAGRTARRGEAAKVTRRRLLTAQSRTAATGLRVIVTSAAGGIASVECWRMIDAGTEHLIKAVQDLSLARSLDRVQEIVRHAARELTGADGATFVLRDDDKCFYADEDAVSPLWKGQRFPLKSCISGWAMLNQATGGDPRHLRRRPHPPRRLPTHVREEPGDGPHPAGRSRRRHRQLLGRATRADRERRHAAPGAGGLDRRRHGEHRRVRGARAARRRPHGPAGRRQREAPPAVAHRRAHRPLQPARVLHARRPGAEGHPARHAPGPGAVHRHRRPQGGERHARATRSATASSATPPTPCGRRSGTPTSSAASAATSWPSSSPTPTIPPPSSAGSAPTSSCSNADASGARTASG